MKFFKKYILFTLLMISALPIWAQEIGEKKKPDQLDIFKINLFQLGVNEARLLYEHQLAPTTSVEFGLGYIYPNRFWYERGGATMLTKGAGVYVSFRKYFDKKRYIYQPFFRSYTSIMLFGRTNRFDDEWLLFGSGNLDISYQCELFSMKMQQYGAVFRVGFQSRAGRLVLDMYTGIGLKFVPSVTTSHAINDCTQVCAIIPSSEIRELVSRDTEVEVVLNAGVQIGLRRNNRERKIREGKHEEGTDYPETPPQF